MLRLKNLPFFGKQNTALFEGTTNNGTTKIAETLSKVDKDVDNEVFEKQNPDSKIFDTKEDTISKNEKIVETIQPSYLGYLSGVFTNIWNQTVGPEDIKNDELIPGSKINGKSKLNSRDASPTRVTKILIKKASRAEISNRTKVLVDKLMLAQATSSKILRMQMLSQHIQEFPGSRMVAVSNQSLVAYLLNQVESAAEAGVQEEARMCLSLCGYSPVLDTRGIRILSIDGGGTRGMMGLTILAAIEKAAGKKIYELFDHITGVSTGAILAVLLGIKKCSVEECKTTYMDISRRLFNQGKLSGVSGLLMSHSYYNTTLWVDILKEKIGENITCSDTAKQPKTPRLCVASCIVNSPQLQPYMFRNYELPGGNSSHYRGGTQHKVWQAIQASAAAPGYFEEVRLGTILHQDGGVLANNPTAIAIHESKKLWPNDPVQCVVSIGNGRSVAELELTTENRKLTKLQDKISKIVDSATDTEATHQCVNDLLPDGTYFRFNPYMSFPYTLDEIQEEKLDQMQRDANLYVRRNARKLDECAKTLLIPPSYTQTLKRQSISKLHKMGIFKLDF
uniref:PNPLA domain-containing protein n=1 Tax=Rhabditophanes sp. KR3021 TaxID=114890 RepID=A0AC35U5S4_9BILA